MQPTGLHAVAAVYRLPFTAAIVSVSNEEYTHDEIKTEKPTTAKGPRNRVI